MRLHEFFAKLLPWMNGLQFPGHDRLLPVVIHDFDLVRVALAPHETNAPLVVDPNTVLAFSFPAQPFQPIPRRRGQIADSRSEMQLVELSPGDALNSLEPPHRFSLEEALGIAATEGADHTSIL